MRGRRKLLFLCLLPQAWRPTGAGSARLSRTSAGRGGILARDSGGTGHRITPPPRVGPGCHPHPPPAPPRAAHMEKGPGLRPLCPHRHTIYSLSLSFLFYTMGRMRPRQSQGSVGTTVVWHAWQGFLSLPAARDLRAQASQVALGAQGPEGRLLSWSFPPPGSDSRGTCWTSHPHYSPLTGTFLSRLRLGGSHPEDL